MPYGKILMVDEDAQLRRAVTDYLEAEGMEVISSSRIDEFSVDAAEKASVIILSSTISDEIGSSIATLRAGRNTPLIMLIYNTEDNMLYFRLGADQVLLRPFNIAELSLRISALLRRAENGVSDKTEAVFRGMQVNLKEYSVIVDGCPVELPPKEIEMLFLLTANPGKIFSRNELSSRVWGRILADNRTIAVHINRIRSKIGAYARHIVAVRGVGYKLSEKA